MISNSHFRYWIIFCLALTASGVIAALNLPEDMILPIHWNASGKADGFASKWLALMIMPIVATIMSVIMAWLPNLGPLKHNIEHNMPVYQGVWACMLTVFAFGHYTVFAGAFGWPVLMPEGLFVIIALLLGLLGNYIPKLKPSLFIGIRTRWTLANEEVWIKTHRLGGKLLLGAAAAIMIAVFLGFTPEAINTVIIVSLLIAALAPILWSYLLWQKLEAK
jgi:uncharacterized membrane protein